MIIIPLIAHGSIQITTNPSPAYYTQGSEISVTCIYPGDRYSLAHWLHPTNGTIPVSGRRFVVTTFSDGESTLRIMNAMESDEGEYQCVISESSSTM